MSPGNGVAAAITWSHDGWLGVRAQADEIFPDASDLLSVLGRAIAQTFLADGN